MPLPSARPAALGYFDSPWPAEDGGPSRPGRAPTHPGLLGSPAPLEVTSRLEIACTMAVLREPGEVYLLTHGIGGDAACAVERIDPQTLERRHRSADLPGGPIWPGGLGVHRNGDLYVVFGRHAHRLTPDLEISASATLPRERPYNSFVVLDDGHLVTKDFGGRLPDGREPHHDTELLVLDPERLDVCSSYRLDEPSVARLSALGQQVIVVGTTHLFVLEVDPLTQQITEVLRVRYRTLEGQTYGWDATVVDHVAWFLDNGEGSEGFDGSFTGKGRSAAPLHLVRVDLRTGMCSLTEICGRPEGLIANPPLIDPSRGLAIGYDSANAVLACFALDDEGQVTPRWERAQAHGSHLLLLDGPGELITGDYRDGVGDELVVLDVGSGQEFTRVATGSPVQSVLFPAAGFGADLYYCSFTTIARVAAGDAT